MMVSSQMETRKNECRYKGVEMSSIINAENYVGKMVWWDDDWRHGRFNTVRFGIVDSVDNRVIIIDGRKYLRNDLNNFRNSEVLTCQK